LSIGTDAASSRRESGDGVVNPGCELALRARTPFVDDRKVTRTSFGIIPKDRSNASSPSATTFESLSRTTG